MLNLRFLNENCIKCDMYYFECNYYIKRYKWIFSEVLKLILIQFILKIQGNLVYCG